MICTLEVRDFEEKDCDIECLFMPERERLTEKIYVKALVEDIEGINGVSMVTRDKYIITITLQKPMDKEKLKEAMKPYFQRDYCYYRYVSLNEANPA